MSKIIAVAAPIGGGKTSLVKAIANRLDDAAMLFYDHYEKATGQPVHDLEQWINNGADFNEFTIPGLADDQLGYLSPFARHPNQDPERH